MVKKVTNLQNKSPKSHRSPCNDLKIYMIGGVQAIWIRIIINNISCPRDTHNGMVHENKKSARAKLATSITATVRPRL